jgi:hypothetical protein
VLYFRTLQKRAQLLDLYSLALPDGAIFKAVLEGMTKRVLRSKLEAVVETAVVALVTAKAMLRRSKAPKKKKAAFSVIKKCHRIIRDMVLSDVLDESSPFFPLLDKLDTILYKKLTNY